MRIIQFPQQIAQKLNLHETLFLDCWHCFAHRSSLDSYRTKCLNAKSVCQELRDEIEIGRIEEVEFFDLTRDFREVLGRDVVVCKHYTRQNQRLFKLIEDLEKEKIAEKSKDKNDARMKRQPLLHAVSDLAAVLESDYLGLLTQEIDNAIRSGDQASIPQLVNSLLSDLVARGWQLRKLWTWHLRFLEVKPFAETFAQLISAITRPPSRYQIALRIHGGISIRSIQSFGAFAVCQSIDFVSQLAHEKRFIKPNQYSVFAVGTYESVDFQSAAVLARDELDPLLDAIRFEFEPGALRVFDHALVKREADNRLMLVSLENDVPNPNQQTDVHDFQKFASQLNQVFNSSNLEDESINRVTIALRRYRAGRDSYKYSDKFLYWWMGLEALTNSSSGKIGRTVSKHTSYVMLSGYLERIVDDLLHTIRFLRVDWSQEYDAVVPNSEWRYVTTSQFVSLLRDANSAQTLLQQLASRHLVTQRILQVKDWLTNPTVLAKQLKDHLARVQWHLDRLYRIRCCLVHGSPVRFKLALFTANLEFYLKQTLAYTLQLLCANDHVASLDGLFVRTNKCWETLLEELSTPSADQTTIDRVINFDVFPPRPFSQKVSVVGAKKSRKRKE